MTTIEKLAALRVLMRESKMDAYIVSSADAHQSEYVAAHWQARAWLSGFTGSAGTLVVTPTYAGLWVDPRYHMRAETELRGSGIVPFKMGLPGVLSYAEWLARELDSAAVLGFDGNVFSSMQVAELMNAFREKQIVFEFQRDLLGQIWQDRPPMPRGEIFLHETQYAGETRASKIERVRAELAAQIYVVSALDEIAWVLNIRGRDVEYNPVVISYLVISSDVLRWFVDSVGVPPDVRVALEKDGVSIFDYHEIFSFAQSVSPNATVLFDPEKTSYSLGQMFAQACRVKQGASILSQYKAIKIETELAGIRNAHVRDGVAVVKWMYWLGQQTFRDYHTELTLAEKLLEFRCAVESFASLSFGTIIGYGANSAVGHYSAHADTTPTIKRQGILLVDSGAQYPDGTTDITRTLTLGSPTPEQKRAFTLVLRGLIRLSRAIFPEGTRGNQLDVLAREELWQQGWNCRHGIGHGIGFYLNVHEGPQHFSPDNTVVFEPGMVTSSEPGVYFEGRFGVRLENVLITVADATTEFGKFLRFETVTLCPIDLELVENSMLYADEKIWLNEYHQHVFDTLAPFLSREEAEWLRHETRSI